MQVHIIASTKNKQKDSQDRIWIHPASH
uniref:Uncharacterized protein n=1 Tax=Arundo donax TaxID=35708 RepID=A0A0A9GND6_ARUDO